MFKIDKSVTIYGCYKYPFDKMIVGDSFAFPDELSQKIRCAAWRYGKKNAMKFIVKKQQDGFRCWRVE